MSEYDIRPIDESEADALRHAVLRGEATRFEDVSTLHVGGFRGEHLAGVASISRRRLPSVTDADAWRIEGLVVEHGHRGWGLGGRLLERCLEHAAVHTATIAWGDVPAGAFGFFDRFGFERVGDPFRVDGTPCYRMAIRFRSPEAR